MNGDRDLKNLCFNRRFHSRSSSSCSSGCSGNCNKFFINILIPTKLQSFHLCFLKSTIEQKVDTCRHCRPRQLVYYKLTLAAILSHREHVQPFLKALVTSRLKILVVSHRAFQRSVNFCLKLFEDYAFLNLPF